MYNHDHGSTAAGTSAVSEVTSPRESDLQSGHGSAGRLQRLDGASDRLNLQLNPLSFPNKIVNVDLGSGQPLRVNVLEPLQVIVGDGDCECNEAVKEQNKNSAVAARECASRKDGCAAVSSYPSPLNKLPEATFRIMTDYIQPKDLPERPSNYYRYVPRTAEEMDEEVEYDMDEMVC